MGEVVGMKKVISVVMCAVMLLCCGCFAGCNNQNDNSIADKILNSIKDSGYSEAHYRSDVESLNYPYIYFDETNTDSLTLYDHVLTLDLNEESNVPKILNSILPALDSSFFSGDGEIVYRKLMDSRELDYDGKIHQSNVYYKNYCFAELLPVNNTDAPIKSLIITHQ